MTTPLASTRSLWTIGRPLRQPPRMHLYCFPHSGGLPSEYIRWGRELPGVQVYGVCPPGRGPRLGQPPHTRMPDLVASLLDETQFAAPFVLLGHSLGALVAFEVARALRARGRAMPQRLIVSAHAAPHLPRKPTSWDALPDAELMSIINENYDGIPGHVAADPELMALSLPAIRADFALLDNYHYRYEEPLAVPIDAFLGDADIIPLHHIAQWRTQTIDQFHEHRFAGGHFYFREVEIYGVLRGLTQTL